MSVIGIVRLAPGQVGYFDDVTRIHLTIASPEKPVISGMNTANLKRAVKSGRILLTTGSLDATVKVATPMPVEEVQVETPVQVPVESVEVQEEIKEESGVVTLDTEAAVQKIQEESVEEAIVEEQPEVVEETVVEEEATESAEVEETAAVEDVEESKTEEKVSAKKTNSTKKK
jgi:hypothetical protein